MATRREFVFGLGLGSAGAIYGGPVFAAAQPGRDPVGANGGTTVEHVRKDEQELREMGEDLFVRPDPDDVVNGMGQLGLLGYELLSVTSVLATGGAGFHLFKRQPWGNRPGRPRFEFLRLDNAGLEKLGEGKFDEGLRKLETEGWELKAVTQTLKGAVGFYYFQRAGKR